MERAKVRSKIGFVVSNKMDKTVVVNIVQIKNHPVYGKPIKRNKKFKAHDEKNVCNIGDKVLIVESRPYSRTKSWRVTEVIERTKVILDADSGGINE